MTGFEKEELIGPEATRPNGDSTPEGEQPADERSGGLEGDPEMGSARPRVASIPVQVGQLLKDNRRVAILGSFAIGVFLGSLSKS